MKSYRVYTSKLSFNDRVRAKEHFDAVSFMISDHAEGGNLTGDIIVCWDSIEPIEDVVKLLGLDLKHSEYYAN